MEAELKKTLKAVTLELRHLLEGRYDSDGQWKPGDLEQRLAAIGVRRDRDSVPVDELAHLTKEDRRARTIVDAYLKLREEAGVGRPEAVGEFVRETAYTWANRLLALRCMEARELIDPVILQQEAYGGRSLEHHRLAQRRPELCAGDDDGLFAVLDKVFREQAERLPMLFDSEAPGVAHRPSPAALKDCIGLLSLNPDTLRKYRIRLKENDTADAGAEPPNPFAAPDALGWTYQYWNTEEKDRVFEIVRTVKGAKIAGADIIPATQLYTEDYMVKFLVQNSLGATWMGMHPESKLAEKWEYYVRDADRAPVEKKPIREITFLDPACGSGHFLLEAFDLFYAIYQEEGELTQPQEICDAILTKNLFGIDIDPRAVQIAEVVLWMKAAERAFDYKGVPTNLVAATATHFKGEAWEEFLAGFELEPSVARVLRKFAQTMEHIDEIGSLARPAEDLREIIQEEHATWERQVRAKREGNYLFPEMNEDAISGQLPFHEISDEEFGERLFYRVKVSIDSFTARARAAGEFEDQMLGSETRAGFRLVDLLSRRYDIVTANPPYLGDKKMADSLHKHIQLRFPYGKQDLFAAFIISCHDLVSPAGHVGLVTRSGWLTLRSYGSLRTSPTSSRNPDDFRVLTHTSLEIVCDLGSGAFEEIAGEVVTTCMTVTHSAPAKKEHIVLGLQLTQVATAAAKASALTDYCAAKHSIARSFRRPQSHFSRIPYSPIAYSLPDSLVSLFGTLPALHEDATCTDGANARRFILRFHWEVPYSPKRWFPYCKGGEHVKWRGNETYVYDFENRGQRLKAYIDTRYPYLKGNYAFLIKHEELYGQPGLTFSDFASGRLVVRMIPENGLPGHSGPAIYIRGNAMPTLAVYLNSRVATRLLKTYTSVLHIMYTDVKLLPWLASRFDNQSQVILKAFKSAIASATEECARDMCELFFDLPGPLGSTVKLREFARIHLLASMATWFRKTVAEGVAERCVTKALDLDDEAIQHLALTEGRMYVEFPRISKRMPIDDVVDGTLLQLANSLQSSESRINAESAREQIRRLFAEGSFGPLTQDSAREDEEKATETLGEDDVPNADEELEQVVPSSASNLFESICRRVGVHSIDVYLELRDGIIGDNWHNSIFERGSIADVVSMSALRLLGHRWPKQLEANEPVPDWADPNGFISLKPLAKEAMLFERAQDRLRADNIDASDFAEVMGKQLDAWLATEFFQHHTKQFKKRPIAWQLQSGRFTTRTSPAFACLLYYHKLDADTLPKLRSQHVGPLRQRLETEQRGILAVAAEARSDRQVKRQAELEDAILELHRFDATLETVAGTGFGGPQSLITTLRQYAIDDAMLALKARWLRRLSDLISRISLSEWLSAADRTGLHPDFSVWIADAMAHVDHFCARLGPQSPKQETLQQDPTAADLAGLIAEQSAFMLSRTLELACGVWWNRFEEVVLAPLKEQLKEIKFQQKASEDQLKADPEPEPMEARALRARIKKLKADAKELTADIKDKTGRAGSVRESIEKWRHEEPLAWGDWLAQQPLFDQISSLDQRRPAPKTIAEFIAQESLYAPDINDGVRVNIAPLQKAGLLAADVLAPKDLNKAIADRAEWRADERRWVRAGKLPQPGWWTETGD